MLDTGVVHEFSGDLDNSVVVTLPDGAMLEIFPDGGIQVYSAGQEYKGELHIGLATTFEE